MTIEVTFAPVGGETVFTDVPETFWAYDEIMWAQENGYVRFATSKKGKLSVALTDKGTMVVEKRLAAEDRAADEVLEGLSDKERECLLKLTGKVIDNCKAMGVDYRTIAVKGCRDRKPGHHHNHGCCRR